MILSNIDNLILEVIDIQLAARLGMLGLTGYGLHRMIKDMTKREPTPINPVMIPQPNVATNQSINPVNGNPESKTERPIL